MNDELFLKQLEQIIPQEDSGPQTYAPAHNQTLPPMLHARTGASERTQHLVWERPAEPRFQVSRGGLQRDWKWTLPAVANITFLTLFILALVCWPRSRPRPVSSPSPAMPTPMATSSATYGATATNGQRVTDSRAGNRAAISPAYRSFRARPSLYASAPVRNFAPTHPTFSFPTVNSYRATSYRVAPAAPIAGSMPPMQPPY